MLNDNQNLSVRQFYYAVMCLIVLTQSYLDIFTQGFHLKLDILDKDDDNDDDEIAVINYSPHVMPGANGSLVHRNNLKLEDGPAT